MAVFSADGLAAIAAALDFGMTVDAKVVDFAGVALAIFALLTLPDVAAVLLPHFIKRPWASRHDAALAGVAATAKADMPSRIAGPIDFVKRIFLLLKLRREAFLP